MVSGVKSLKTPLDRVLQGGLLKIIEIFFSSIIRKEILSCYEQRNAAVSIARHFVKRTFSCEMMNKN